jgi:hypothetical protein
MRFDNLEALPAIETAAKEFMLIDLMVMGIG